MRSVGILTVALATWGCAAVPYHPETEKLGPIVLSLKDEGGPMGVSESPYLFVLYENGRAAYRRPEHGPGRGWIWRYVTAILSPAEMEKLRQAVDPAGVRALEESYDMLPLASDLGSTTLTVGPPWLEPSYAVSIRGFMDSRDIARNQQPPLPAPIARAT